MDVHFYIPLEEWGAWFYCLPWIERLWWLAGSACVVSYLAVAIVARCDPTSKKEPAFTFLMWVLAPLILLVFTVVWSIVAVAWAVYFAIRLASRIVLGIPMGNWTPFTLHHGLETDAKP